MLLALVVETISKHFNVWNEGELKRWRERNEISYSFDGDTYEITWVHNQMFPDILSTSLVVTRLGMANVPLNKEGWSW